MSNLTCRNGHDLEHFDQYCHECVGNGWCGVCGFSLNNHDTPCPREDVSNVGEATQGCSLAPSGHHISDLPCRYCE